MSGGNRIQGSIGLISPTEGNFTPRHGSVILITKEERQRLEDAFGY